MRVFLKKLVEEHWLIMLNACFFSFLLLLPLIIFPLKLGVEYQGINIAQYGPDAHYYLTRGKEAMDGNGLGNIVLKDGKDSQDSFFSYVEYILVAPFHILGLEDNINIVALYNIYNFLGLVVLMMLIYFLIYQITADKKLAILTAIFVVAGYPIITDKTLFPSGFNVFTKQIYPYVSSIIFFVYLNCLVRTIQKRNVKNIILSGMILGATFYVYVYLWTFSVIISFVLLLLFIFKKEWKNVKSMVTILTIGIGLGVYNIIKIVLFFGVQKNGLINYTIRSEQTHTPIFNKMLIVSTLVTLFYFWKHKSDKNWLLLVGLNLSAWIALNQQIITGHQVQPEHYYWQFVIPIFIICLSYIGWHLVSQEKLKKVLFVFMFTILFSSTMIGRYLNTDMDLEAKRYEQRYRPIINYLNSISKSAVVLGPNDLNGLLVTIYTKHDLFWDSFYAPQVNTNIETFYDALAVYSYLNKNARNDFVSYYNQILSDRKDSSPNDYDKYIYQFLDGYSSGLSYATYFKKYAERDALVMDRYPSSTDKFYKKYNELTTNGSDITKILKRHDVGYLLWDTNRYPDWDISPLSNYLTPLINSGGVYLFKIELK